MTDTVKCWLLSKIENLLVFAIFMCIISLSAPVWFIDGYDLMTETQQKETNDIVYTNIFTVNIFEIILLITMFVIAIVGGFKIARYTYDHYGEIISRSFLWRNSKVGIFDTQLKYSIGMFFQSKPPIKYILQLV